MAFGKPVVCYIKPSLVKQYPVDMPIVNATQDTLTEVLESLIQDSSRRHELGKKGRTYVEVHHDALSVTPQIMDIYTDLIR